MSADETTVTRPEPVYTVEDQRRFELAARWKMVVTDTQRFGNEATCSPINSKRWTRVNDTLEEFAARLVGDDVFEDEVDELQTVLTGIWRDIKSDLLLWAERTELRRAGDPVSPIQAFSTWPAMVGD